MPARLNLLDKKNKTAGPAGCTRYKHCQSIRETCGVFLPWNSQKLGHHLWHHTGKLMGVVPVFRKKHAVADLCTHLDHTNHHQETLVSTWYQGCRQTNPKGLRIWRECRKITTDEPSSTCVHCTCWWEFEGKIGSLLGSGAYLECCGCSIANHQSPSELSIYSTTMLTVDVEEKGSVLLVRDMTCLLGPCKNTPWKSLKSSNDLQWPEPGIHCWPQPATMILSTCRISSMYSSAEATSNRLASFKSSTQWLCDFQKQYSKQ